MHQSFAHNRHFAIFVPPVQKRSDYRLYEEEEEEEEAAYASEVLKEYEDSNDLKFLVRLSDGYEKKVSKQISRRYNHHVYFYLVVIHANLNLNPSSHTKI